MKDMSYIHDLKIKNILLEVKNLMLDMFRDNLKDVILYGSCARNENTSESDIDILVLVDIESVQLKKYEDRITDIMVDISIENDIVLSIFTQSLDEYRAQEDVLPFYRNINLEGVKIYG